MRVPSQWEVVSAPEHLAGVAAGALGWDGVVLPPMVLFGRRVVVVATLVGEGHEHRSRSGWPPVTDWVSVCMWDWPEMRRSVPAPAVRLSGVIAPARHWRTALFGAAPFTGVCPGAVLMPAQIARNGECLAHAEYYGVTVLAAAGPGERDPEAVDVVQVGRCRRVESRSQIVFSRWVHEMVYERLLAVVGEDGGTRPSWSSGFRCVGQECRGGVGR